MIQYEIPQPICPRTNEMEYRANTVWAQRDSKGQGADGQQHLVPVNAHAEEYNSCLDTKDKPPDQSWLRKRIAYVENTGGCFKAATTEATKIFSRVIVQKINKPKTPQQCGNKPNKKYKSKGKYCEDRREKHMLDVQTIWWCVPST